MFIRLPLISLMLLFSSIVTSQNLADITPDELELGEIQTNVIHEVFCLVENVYSDSIIITNVQSSWGGLVGLFPESPIAPGGVDTVFVQIFDATGGNRVKIATISINDHPEQEILDIEQFTLKWTGVDSVTTSLNNFERDKELTVYPNPFRDKFFILCQDISQKYSKLEFFDESGKLLSVKRNGFLSEKFEFPKDLIPGVYFLSIKTDDGKIHIKKVIKK